MYEPRHARHPHPSELPPAMRGLANLIVIVPSQGETQREDQT